MAINLYYRLMALDFNDQNKKLNYSSFELISILKKQQQK